MPSGWSEDRYGGYGREQSRDPQNSRVRGSRSRSYYDKYKVTDSGGGGRSRGDSRRRSRDRGRRDRSRSRDRSRGRRRKSRSSSRSRSRSKAAKKKRSGWDEPPTPAEIIVPPGHSGGPVDPGLAAIAPGQGVQGISVAPPPDAPPVPPPPYTVPKGSSIQAALEQQAQMLAAKAEGGGVSQNSLIAETIADAKAKAACINATATPKSTGYDSGSSATPTLPRPTLPTPAFTAVSPRLAAGPGTARPVAPPHSIYQRSGAANNNVLPPTAKPMPQMPKTVCGVRPPVPAKVPAKAPVVASDAPVAMVVSKAARVPAENFAPTNSGSAAVENASPVHFGEFVQMKEVSPALAALMSGSL